MARTAFAAGAVASGTVLISGVAQAADRPDGGISVANISVLVGSGVHTETITVRPDSPALGVQYSLVVFSSSGAFLGTPVPSSSTHAACTKGAEGVFGNEGYAWTCTSTRAGWGAGTISVSVNITQSGLQHNSPQCLNGGCAIGIVADWTAPIGGAQGTITIVPGQGVGIFPSSTPSASKTVRSTPSGARTSARTSPNSAPPTSAATASAPSATDSALMAPLASDAPSTTATAAATSSTHGSPLDAAPTGGDGGSGSTQLWALLGAVCIVAAGVTSAVIAGKGRHRA